MDAVKHMGEQSIGRLLLRYSLPAIGFYGIYLVGPCADLLFAVIAANVMMRELGRLRLAPDLASSP